MARGLDLCQEVGRQITDEVDDDVHGTEAPGVVLSDEAVPVSAGDHGLEAKLAGDGLQDGEVAA